MMTKIIDFEKKRREKLSSLDQFSKSKKSLRGERNRLSGKRGSNESQVPRKDRIKASKEEMLLEIYIVETIQKLRNLYIMLAIFATISSISISSWTVNNTANMSALIPGFMASLASAYVAYVMVIKAMGEHYFKRRFKKSFSNLLDHLEEQEAQDETYDDFAKEAQPPAP
jgi:hypothetical protein